jgi:hypothetical protein
VTLRPAAANAACTAPVPLADGATLTAQNLLDAISPVVGCASGGNAGPALFYSATIPGNSYLSARMVPTGPTLAGSVLFWAPRLRVLGDCGGAACLAQSTYPLNAVLYRNPDATPRTVLLAASTDGGSFDGVFDLSAEVRPAPANNACANATTLTDGLHLPEENLQLATDALGGVCAPEVEGNALYYRATVPPGAQLSVVLHAIDTAQLVPRLLAACGASSCGAAYTPGSAVQHPLLWSNPGGAAQDVVVAVSSYNAFASGRFELWSNIAPPAYTEATIAGACDDLSAAPAVADVDAFRSVSEALPLPFPFALFGEVTNDFAVASTGQLELFPDETGTPTLTTVPPPMPSVVGPHRFVAPLALPLSAAPEGSSVRTQTFGAAPSRRFVVEWNNWSIPRPADASRVTFQAKLFEGSNAVEFHYCSLNGLGTSTPYQNAPLSVGLEDASGLRAVRHAVTPTAPLSTAQALRFVPAN